MADANQSLRQHVDQEPSQELIGRNGHHLLRAAVGVVLPAEGDAIFLKGDEAMVGDGDAVRVASKVVEDMLRSTEGWLGVDDPLLRVKLSQELGEALGSRKLLERAVKLELALNSELLESSDELAAEDAAENTNGQEET